MVRGTARRNRGASRADQSREEGKGNLSEGPRDGSPKVVEEKKSHGGAVVRMSALTSGLGRLGFLRKGGTRGQKNLRTRGGTLIPVVLKRKMSSGAEEYSHNHVRHGKEKVGRPGETMSRRGGTDWGGGIAGQPKEKAEPSIGCGGRNSKEPISS